MKYVNTAGSSPALPFAEALLLGPAPGGGLFMPQHIPFQEEKAWRNLFRLPLTVSGALILHPFMAPDWTLAEVESLLEEALSFPLPLKRIAPGIQVLETFHGPTLAFKDLGARFLARCLARLRSPGRPLTVLVATSGDTGGAVAAGFSHLEGIRVVILYPGGRVSDAQEMQLLRAGPNVTALRVRGSFDDCQRMVKGVFGNKGLQAELGLTSANSINIARWLPQALFYLAALQQWPEGAPPVIAVPSGNFGNLAAAYLMKRSGLPCGPLLAACNSNDPVPRFLSGAPYAPEKVQATLSNAMDVAAPSNFARLLALGSPEELRRDIKGFTVSDTETEAVMRRVHVQYGYLLDPHTAVAWRGAEQYRTVHPGSECMVVATAHPVKFAPDVARITGVDVPWPPALLGLNEREERVLPMEPRTEALLQYLAG